MAYAFSRTMDAIGEGDDQQKANIFAEPNSGLRGSVQAQTDQGTVEKTNTEFSQNTAGTGAGNVGQSSNTQADAQGGGSSSGRAEMGRRNIGKIDVSKLGTLNSAQGSLANAQQSVQNEADAYMADTTKKTTENDLDDTTLSKAVSGDGDAFTKVTSAFGGVADPGEAFSVKTDHQIEPIQDLRSTAGIRSMLRSDIGDDQYNRGEAGFDAMLLGQDDNFRNVRQALVSGQEDLYQTVDKLNEKTNEDAKKLLEDDRKADQDRYTSYFTGELDKLKAAQEAEAESERQERENIPVLGKVRGEIDKTVSNELQMLKSIDPAMYQYIVDNSLDLYDTVANNYDLGNYYTMGGDFGWQDFVDEKELGQFNNLASILGLANMPVDPTISGLNTVGDRGGDPYTLNRDLITSNVQNTIRELLERKYAEDEIMQQKIAEMAAAQEAARVRARQEAINKEVQADSGKKKTVVDAITGHMF